MVRSKEISGVQPCTRKYIVRHGALSLKPLIKHLAQPLYFMLAFEDLSSQLSVAHSCHDCHLLPWFPLRWTLSVLLEPKGTISSVFPKSPVVMVFYHSDRKETNRVSRYGKCSSLSPLYRLRCVKTPAAGHKQQTRKTKENNRGRLWVQV